MDPQRRSRFTFIAWLLFLLFSYPILSAANKPVRIYGIPLLYIYLPVVWITGIIALYFTANIFRKKNRP